MQLIAALYLHYQEQVIILMLAYARIAVVFYLLPVLGERVLSNAIVKNVIILLVAVGLWPYYGEVRGGDDWCIVLFREFTTGLVIAVALCTPFWIATALGEYLDNQRGATISDSIDPMNGVSSSLMSGFMSFAFGALFFSTGGMRFILETLARSYEIVPAGLPYVRVSLHRVGLLLEVLAENSLLIAGPVLMVMMLTEIMLGVFSRYCPQLNPFSLSLNVKSLIAFLIFVCYGFLAMTENVQRWFYLADFRHFL